MRNRSKLILAIAFEQQPDIDRDDVSGVSVTVWHDHGFGRGHDLLLKNGASLAASRIAERQSVRKTTKLKVEVDFVPVVLP